MDATSADRRSIISSLRHHRKTLSQHPPLLQDEGRVSPSHCLSWSPVRIFDFASSILQAGGTALPDAQASVAVNSLGLFDLVQIEAVALTPGSQYQVDLAEVEHAPYRKFEPL